MAGIGFALRSLMRGDSLWSIVESQLHGVVAVAGPWFFTIVGMALPALLAGGRSEDAATGPFVTLLLYVFSVSLTLTSPVAIGLTRHVSDCLYQQREGEIASSVTTAILLGLALGIPVVVFGFTALDLPLETRALAAIAYGLVTVNWIVAPMLSTIRQFRLLTLAYALGTLVFGLLIPPAPHATVPDLLAAFNLGVCTTNAVICGLVLHNFPGTLRPLGGLLVTLRRWWELPVGGLLYGLGIWADKWWMWSAPEHVTVAGGLAAFPMYDTVAFIAYVTTVPALAMFIVQAETAFHESCHDLYGAIRDHAALEPLREAQRRTWRVFLATGRDVALLQVCITGLVLLVPVPLLRATGVPDVGVFMFRYCAMGAALQAGVLMLTIVLHYFDSRRTVLQVNAVFLVSNAVFTWAALQFGFAYYGLGYFVASLVTFATAWVLVAAAFRNLLYLAFVRQNTALTHAPDLPPATQWFETQTAPGPVRPAQERLSALP